MPTDRPSSSSARLPDESTQAALVRDNERLRADLARLSRTHDELEDFFENGSIGLHCVDGDGIIRRVNQTELNLLGYSRDDYIGRSITDFHVDAPVIEDILKRLTNGETLYDYEARLRCKDGSIRHVLINSSVYFRNGRFVHTRCFTRDVTLVKQTQRALAQSHKLEGLGTLAGGVAHDFNNILVSMLGNAELVLEELDENNPAYEPIQTIRTAAMRAASSCSLLLAYSGQGKAEPRATNLSDVVGEISRLLEFAAPARISKSFDLGCNLPAIDADVSQLQQVVMNLVKNAGEAADAWGGGIRVATRLATREEAVAPGSFLSPRSGAEKFVCLEVADTGAGVDVGDLERIFDPFFTTKETGQGLGLAAVLGIVTSHGGTIHVDSEPGNTVFRAYFPASRHETVSAAATAPTVEPETKGTVLVVDDEPSVRSVTERLLKREFHVLTAACGRDGIRVFTEHATSITCVVLDLNLPDLHGTEVFKEIRALAPEVPVVICSGYGKEGVQDLLCGERASFLQKPFTRSRLTEHIAEAMELVDPT